MNSAKSVSALLRQVIETQDIVTKNGLFTEAVNNSRYLYPTYTGDILLVQVSEQDFSLCWRIHLVDSQCLAWVRIQDFEAEVSIVQIKVPGSLSKMHLVAARLLEALQAIKYFNYPIDTGLYAALSRNWSSINSQLLVHIG